MRREHLQRLRPVCPTCRVSDRTPARLQLAAVTRSDGLDIREGVLVCTDLNCQREHPIVDGIPIVVADLQAWASHQLESVLWREDLSPFIESLLIDAAGPGHPLERERATLSAYGRVHWGDFDSAEPLDPNATFASLVHAAFELPPAQVAEGGLWIDLGCAVGRATREAALRTADLAVGVDLSYAMLRTAERLRRDGRAVLPLRRVGLVFDPREVSVPDMPSDRMTFWCCDVGNLPFEESLFDGALSLNLLDCVPSPLQHLMEMGRVLAADAPALLSTPYDWSAAATPLAQWLGGHSQRGEAHGSSTAELRRVLNTIETGLTVESERDRVPWRVYVNERASMDYAVHLLRLVKRSDPLTVGAG